MRKVIYIVIAGSMLCSVLACSEVESSAGKAMDNANSVVRSSGDKMWGNVPRDSSAAQDDRTTEEEKDPETKKKY